MIEEFGYLDQRGVAPEPGEFAHRYRTLEPTAFAELCEALEIQSPGSDTQGSSGTHAIRSDNTIPQSVGRYEIVRSIGKGTFGEVFLARDPELQRNVAIKIPTRQRVEMGGGTKEFLDEARNVARLDHPNIVPVYDCGQTESGICFVVSKYIKGKELRLEIRKGVPREEAARMVAQIARALHSAHCSGLVHRDVKPGNILVDSKRQPHLLDFGLALLAQERWNSESLVGTPAYMSPEQAMGGDQSIDGRSDIYSLGVVLYELLTGRRPVHSNDPQEVIKQVSLGEVRPPRQLDDSIPPELERICMTALAKRLPDRYSTAKDFADHLDQYLHAKDQPGSGLSPSSDSSWNPYPRKPLEISNSRGVTGWVLAALLVGVVASAAYFFRTNPTNVGTGLERSTEIRNPGKSSADSLPSDARRQRLAVLSLRNLAGPQAEWLSTGLKELLTLELDKSQELDVIPSASVDLLKSDLQLFHADTPGASTLANIVDRIGAAWIVTGKVTFAGAQLELLRLEIKVRNTAQGNVVSVFDATAKPENWEQFVALAATQIRSDLNLEPLDLMKTGQFSLGVPVGREAASEYFMGISRMRGFDLQAARGHLLKAAQLDPKSAVVQDALAQVLRQLGNENAARDHSRRAVEQNVNLPGSQRWGIAARNHLLEGQPDKAVAVLRELFRNSNDVSEGIELAEAMVTTGQGKSALSLIKELRLLAAHASESVQIEIVAADAAHSISEFNKQAEFARKANEMAGQIHSPRLQAQALLRLGNAMHRLGNRDAIKKLQQAFKHFDQLGDLQGAAKALGAIAKTYIDTGDLDTAEEKISEAIQLSNKIGSSRLQNGFIGQQGELLIYRGQFDKAIKTLRQAQANFVQTGDRSSAAGLGLTLANVLARKGQSEQAHDLIADARKTFQAAGNRQAEARTWGQQGAIHGRAGDPSKARRHFERALELFQEVGDRRGEATCLGDLANTYSGAGDLEQAGKLLSKSLELHRQLASHRGPTTVMYNLGLLYMRTGRPKDALPLLTEAYESFRDRGNLMNACFVQRKLGDLQMQLGDLNAARRSLEKSLETAIDAGSKKSVEAAALGTLAELEMLQADFEAAIDLNLKSRKIRKELHQDGHVAINNLQLARIAMRQDRVQDARELLRLSKDALTMNQQGWDWIFRLVDAQLLRHQSPSQESTFEISETLRQFEEYLETRESQDQSNHLLLQFEHARLLAVLDNPRASKAFAILQEKASRQGLLATALAAQVERFEFLSTRQPLDRLKLQEVLNRVQSLGFLDLENRLLALLDSDS